ncbi:MAG TPA: TrmH family RNA methyltransferase [bacterium]|nr:TrmH family RNA methyltransferase [bacterium]
MNKNIFVVLHNIRSLNNVGSIFRTADGAGVLKIFLTGYTPAPVDSFNRERKEIHKTALGAEKFIEWEKTGDIGKLIKKLRKEGVCVVAVEQSPKAIDYKKFKPKFPLAIILGNEVRGLSKKVLEKCGAIAQIPMCGKKESLNIAVAAGIALYEFKNKI